MESPRWLDEQLEAALDQNRPWWSGASSPLTPTHDQLIRVPVYSPGNKIPTKVELPAYLELRQGALNTVKRKSQMTDTDSRLKLADGQIIKHDSLASNASESQDQSSDDESSRPSPSFEDQNHRTTRDFQEYFTKMTRSLGLEDHKFSSLSWTEKQVVMYRYGNTKTMKTQPSGSDVEREKILSMDGFVKDYNYHRHDRERRSDVMQRIAQAWQKYGSTVTELTPRKQIRTPVMSSTANTENSSKIGEASRGTNQSMPDLPSLQADCDDVFVSGTSSRSLRRRPSALWLFPKPSLPNLGSLERQAVAQRDATGPEMPTIPRLVSKDQLAVRRVLSLSTRTSVSAASTPIGMPTLEEDAQLVTPTQKLEDSQSPAPTPLSADSQIIAFGKLSQSQLSPMYPNLAELTTALSSRAFRRLSTMPSATRSPNEYGKAPELSPDPKREASSADLKPLTSTAPKPDVCTHRLVLEQSMDQVTPCDTKMVLESAEDDANKFCETRCVLANAPDTLGKSLLT